VEEPPTPDDFLAAIDTLARLVRAAFDEPKSVSRAALLAAPEQYEAIDRASRKPAD
jgi:hypothetical protein